MKAKLAFASSAQVRVSARNMLIQSICDADRFQSGGRGLQAEWNLFHLILFQREDNKFFFERRKAESWSRIGHADGDDARGDEGDVAAGR